MFDRLGRVIKLLSVVPINPTLLVEMRPSVERPHAFRHEQEAYVRVDKSPE